MHQGLNQISERIATEKRDGNANSYHCLNIRLGEKWRILWDYGPFRKVLLFMANNSGALSANYSEK